MNANFIVALGRRPRHRGTRQVFAPNPGLTVSRFFPPKYIQDVGTFQDAGPLENDPTISALSEVSALFPGVEEPDFVLSLGTGEPKPTNNRDNPPRNSSRNIWKNGAFPRLCRLFWEKMRDKNVRQAFLSHPRYHRLNIQFDGDEPRLDDAQSIPLLKTIAEKDESVSDSIENIARCVIASLFYFELDSIPRRTGGKYVGSGHILCSIRRGDPAFRVLFDRLFGMAAQFWVNKCPWIDINDSSCFDSHGNFKKALELSTEDKFSISLKQDSSETFEISGSPFTIGKLVLQQGLNAVFGRADHRKRKTTHEHWIQNKRAKLCE
jgi:hypothetical protein